MTYDIILNLPGWESTIEEFADVSGAEITHLEASDRQTSSGVDIYLGPMPDGETAEDQAFANYAETVGFDDDDEDCPIFKFKFNGRNAWGFEAYADNDQPMRFFAQEVRKGLLSIVVVSSETDKRLLEVVGLLEKNLRIKSKESGSDR